ncbi:MAG: HEPN domain-containing protein [Candidatus Diapherotrites archaeon]|nr:HEPN domain-containing protein [Candidatus Diapherotrites archaeon]
MIDFNECLEKRLLRKEKPDKEKALIAVNISEERLMDAEISFEGEVFSAAILLSYASMFHASRALLFKDGFTERSHICLIEFIKEKYIKKGLIESKFSSLLNNAREERHEILYGLQRTETKKDSELVLKTAKEYLKEVKKIIES